MYVCEDSIVTIDDDQITLSGSIQIHPNHHEQMDFFCCCC